MSTADRPPHPSPAEPPSGGSPLRVLVVDDEPEVRRVARRALEARGHLVLEAASGRRALELLREGAEVGAVVTDLKMADGSGGWLLANIAYEFPQLLPFLVMVTGDAGSASVAHVTARWNCPVLPKPFSGAQLLGVLASLGLARSLG